MKVTLLGSGTSGGVPRAPRDWGDADPNNPKNFRRRASFHIQSAETSILFDTSPDLRMQAYDADIQHIDAVFYTHDHADHVHGIDDLRGYFHNTGKRVAVYGDRKTLDVIMRRFDYVFETQDGYPAICDAHYLTGDFAPVTIGDLKVIPFLQGHGKGHSIGYRVGDVAYSTDVNYLSDQAFEILDGVKVWFVDALRYDPHPTHAHLDLTLSWIERLQPECAVLTHLDRQMDFETLSSQVPDNVRVGFDGISVTI